MWDCLYLHQGPDPKIVEKLAEGTLRMVKEELGVLMQVSESKVHQGHECETDDQEEGHHLLEGLSGRVHGLAEESAKCHFWIYPYNLDFNPIYTEKAQNSN